MATSLTEAFVKHYEAEVQAAYQRMGSKLRNTVRTRNNIRGSTAVFQKVGSGEATIKSTGASIDTLNGARTSTEVTLTNYYAGDWVDILDDLKTDSDEKMVVAQTGAYALGRKTDEIIMQSLLDVAVPFERQVACSTKEVITRDDVLKAFKILGDHNIPDDGQRFAIVGWQEWTELLKIPEFATADYVGEEQLPWNGTQVKYWLGSYWIPYSDIQIKTLGSKRYRNIFWYHRNAIGHAIGKDITSDITWHGDHAAYFVNNMMSQGAGVIDEEGIVRIQVETEAAATLDSKGKIKSRSNGNLPPAPSS